MYLIISVGISSSDKLTSLWKEVYLTHLLNVPNFWVSHFLYGKILLPYVYGKIGKQNFDQKFATAVYIGSHLGNPLRKIIWIDFYCKSLGVCHFSWDSPLCPLLYICVIGPERNYLSLYRIKYPSTGVEGSHFKLLYVIVRIISLHVETVRCSVATSLFSSYEKITKKKIPEKEPKSRKKKLQKTTTTLTKFS